MKICELDPNQIKIGMRIKSLISDKRGTIVKMEVHHDKYFWVLWDGDDKPFNGFFYNHCDCEIVSEY